MISQAIAVDRRPNETRARRIFDGLLLPGEDRVRVTEILRVLSDRGIRQDDPRLAPVGHLLQNRESGELSYDEFLAQARPCVLILEQILTGALVIPEFARFCSDIQEVFESARSEQGGKIADYIPKLSRANPERYGLSLCTIDGQRASFGDAWMPFSAQCIHKPLTYSRALEDCGPDALHSRIGCEPSGRSFNDIVLDGANRPHNPMLNAGSILCSAMIRPESHISDRFEHIVDLWQAMAGGERPGFDNATYLSERRTADRNNALTYFMKEHGAFPENSDAFDALDLYLQSCSLEVTTALVAKVAATLAAGGICPLTDERVLQPDTVQKSLSFMYSCGMYDYSGRWSFQIGLPAKSGVSGGVMIVVPNVMGLCVWSPRLEPHGNSQRGIEFARRLVERFNFHVYDGLGGVDTGKTDPRRRSIADRRQLLVDLCWASSEGDCDGIQRLLVRGADLNAADYDGRTPLHLAASEGRADAVTALLKLGASPTKLDRWGNTPQDDARREGHVEVAELLVQGTT
jgi:glutaminase